MPLVVATRLEVEAGGLELRRLKQKVDLPALIARGWDPECRAFAPPADDALFGYLRCERVRCPRAGESRRARALGLCDPCAKNFLFRAAKTAAGGGAETLEQFKTRPLLRNCQWPSVSPQVRPSVLPTGGHLFSPLVAMGSPHDRVG
jgi:hypothetical protein